MRNVPDRHRKWLLSELPFMEHAGVLSPESAERIRSFYTTETRSGLHWALVACAVLGALLIGGGIILLFAHNWDALPRAARATLSFLPVALGAALSAAALLRGWGTAGREAAALFQSFAVGASIALVGQTYHLSADAPAFLLTWALLILPLPFLLRATAAMLVYLGLVVGWGFAAQQAYGQAAAFWPLLLPPAVRLAQQLRADRDSVEAAVGLAGLVAAFCVGTGAVLERTLPGLWIVAYSALLSGAALLGLALYGGRTGWGNLPKSLGLCGTVLLAYVFTWSEPWRAIGWDHLRHDWAYRAWGVWYDSAVTLALLAGCAVAAAKAFRRDALEAASLALFPVVATLCYAAGSLFENARTLNALAFNAFLFLFGVLHIVLGCRRDALRQLNFGMAVVSLLLVTRFFDTDFSYWARSLVFIGLGAAFLTVNLVMARRVPRKGGPA